MIPRATLRDIDLFRDLPDAHLDRLGSAGVESAVRRGDPIYREGEAADRLYAVVSGVVDVGRTGRDGRFVRLTRLERGEVFGTLHPAGPRARYGAAVAAIVPETHLVSWNPTDLQNLMNADPAFGLAFMRAVTARLTGRLNATSEAVYTLLQAITR